MKIITWNCCMAFRRKAEHILKFSPDLLIIPECEHIDKIEFPPEFRQLIDKLWFGKNYNKGLGVFSFGKLRMRTLEFHREEFKMIVPISVTSPDADFNLFAVWANNPGDDDGHYITQVWKAVNHYGDLLRQKPTIVVGDFNSNTIWDYKKHRLGDHSTVVRLLEEKDIISAYHLHHSQVQGKESHATYYMHRSSEKPYHIDYCFASRDLASKIHSVEIGDYDAWVLRKLSDHTPLIIDFDI